MADDAYTVYYWLGAKPFDGRCFSIFRILEHGGKPYHCVSAFKDLAAESGFAVPKVQFPNGLCIAQTAAITMQLGKECNLAPPDWAQEAKAMQLTMDAADFFPGAGKDPERTKKWLMHLQGVLEAAGHGYFVGSGLSYADFAILFPLTKLGRPKLDQHQSLATWFDMMQNLPAVQTVGATGIPLLPTPGSFCKFLCGCARKRISAGTAQNIAPEITGLADGEADTKEKHSYTVYYHGASKNFFGRSYAPLLLLEHAGAQVECDVPENAPPGFFAPPIVKSSSGACISQTPAIMIMLGTELGFAPTDPLEVAKARQLALDAADVLSEASKPPKRITKWYRYLEAVLEAAGGGYFCKGGLSYVDFAMLMSLEHLNTKVKVEMPRLSKWLDMMATVPAVTALRGRGIPLMPA